MSPPHISHPSGEDPQPFFRGLFLKIKPIFIIKKHIINIEITIRYSMK
jgi:hypothetical protein